MLLNGLCSGPVGRMPSRPSGGGVTTAASADSGRNRLPVSVLPPLPAATNSRQLQKQSRRRCRRRCLAAQSAVAATRRQSFRVARCCTAASSVSTSLNRSRSLSPECSAASTWQAQGTHCTGEPASDTAVHGGGAVTVCCSCCAAAPTSCCSAAAARRTTWSPPSVHRRFADAASSVSLAASRKGGASVLCGAGTV